MATTVNGAFADFNRDYVNLNPDRTKLARASRDWLVGRLMALPDQVDGFPQLYHEMHMEYGSFARNTKIRPLDDIDLMLTFHAQSSTHEVILNNEEYRIRPHEAAETLKPLMREDGTLSSIKVVNALITALKTIAQYENAELHRNGAAATLKLSSYEWNFDVVPAFHTDSGHYLIPDGNGNWLPTDPRIDQARIDAVNTQHNGELPQIIRTLKYWNKRAKMTEIPPYVFETMVINFFESQEPVTEFVDLSVRDFLGYLVTGIHFDVSDPKGFQGNLNTLDIPTRNSISEKAQNAFSRANEAIRLETVDHEQQAAIRKWAEIFGSDFS